MKLSTPVVVGLVSLSLFAGCAGESAQVQETRDYLSRVQPIGESLNTEGEAFTVAMAQEGGPDQVALGSIRGSLQTSLDTLKGVSVTDPALQEAHGHLLTGITSLQEGVDELIAVLQEGSVPENFEAELDAKMTLAGQELEAWRNGVAALLPEAERAEFLSEVE